MRLVCGLAVAVLVSGSLAAQRYGGPGGHAGYGGWNGAHFGHQHYSRAAGAVIVPYAYPLGYAYGYGAPTDQSYADSYAPALPPGPDYAPYGPQYAPAPPPPPAPVPHGMILNMENEEESPPEPAHYYIALKDHHVYLAVAYWVEGNTLHYFLPGNTHNQVSLALVDRDLTARLNRESGTEVRLPAE